MSDRRWERNASRTRLLAAALDAVVGQGPSAVSGRAVARSAAVHSVQIQQMFGSVGALLTRAVVDERDRYVEAVFGDPDQAPTATAVADHPAFWRAVAQILIDPGPIDLTALREGGSFELLRAGLGARFPENRAAQLDAVAALWFAAPLGALVFRQPLQEGLGIGEDDWPACWTALGGRIARLVDDPEAYEGQVVPRERREPRSESLPEPGNSRDRLVHAAIELLATRLEGGVTGRELTAAAGVSHGLLAHYFESREAVFDEALRVLHRRFLDDVLAASGDEAEFVLSGHRIFLRSWASRILSGRPTPDFELLGMQHLVESVITARGLGPGDRPGRATALADSMTAVALRLGWTLARPLLAASVSRIDDVGTELVAIDRWILRATTG